MCFKWFEWWVKLEKRYISTTHYIIDIVAKQTYVYMFSVPNDLVFGYFVKQ